MQNELYIGMKKRTFTAEEGGTLMSVPLQCEKVALIMRMSEVLRVRALRSITKHVLLSQKSRTFLP